MEAFRLVNVTVSGTALRVAAALDAYFMNRRKVLQIITHDGLFYLTSFLPSDIKKLASATSILILDI